ncbi:MAG: hypothetical protein ACK5KL_04500 [Dysgonomonas sp.]|jgi:hypothetical protein|nr:hypothetical protein [Prevotella sp.]
MKIVIFLIICIILILSGCKSKKRHQPESINSISLNNYHKEQFIDFFNQTENSAINPYRLKALDEIQTFNSDTIIYYEWIVKPTMIVGVLHFNCSIYESEEKKIHSHKGEVLSNPLSTNINYVKLEKAHTYNYFKIIVKDIEDSNWKKLLRKGEKRSTTAISYYKNMLLVAVKTGGIYKIKSYRDVLLEPKGYIEVEPLNATFE